MNLNDFEDYIDKKILIRGYAYYENDYVLSVKEIENNLYGAEVEGTERYVVEVELDDKANIVDTQCDCPYDAGEYCKHQVAVFLALRNMKSGSPAGTGYFPQNRAAAEAAPQLSVAKKRKAPDIEKILAERTKEELVAFLLDIASESEEIKQRIELNFDQGNDESEIKKSIALIRTFIRNNSDRYGFVDYRHAYEAVKGADLVLEKARSAFAKHKIPHALELTFCIIHEMMDLLGDADDSDGVVSGVIGDSWAFVNEIIEDEELSSAESEIIFHKLLEEASNRRYEDWPDWRLDLLAGCSELAGTPILRSKLENRLVSIAKNQKGGSWSSDYLVEKINLIRYQMIKQYDGQQKAQEFIEQNLQYAGFRKLAIEGALYKKDYASVIKLTLDGEEKDKGMHGLVKQWRQYRYKAYQLSGRLDEQRGLAMDFILDGSFEFYKELKSTYDAGEWRSVYPQIIARLQTQKKMYYDAYTRILIEEGEKRSLLEYVKGSPSTVERFYEHLIPDFKEEVYAVFQQYIEQTAARASSRKDYQGVCAIIRNLKKAGGKEQAWAIKQILLNKYVKKPAFRDELSKV